MILSQTDEYIFGLVRAAHRPGIIYSSTLILSEAQIDIYE